MPPEQGGTGGIGGLAIAIANELGEDNEASATGGIGGVGGNGARSGASGFPIVGAGGQGGQGGRAEAHAITTGSGQARARATGGIGGEIGESAAGVAESDAGLGGQAIASATAEGAEGQAVLAEAFATGGRGGEGRLDAGESGTGGDSIASGRGESAFGENVRVVAEAIGGQGGPQLAASSDSGTGGNASLGRLSGSTSGLLELQATVQGGARGDRIDFSSELLGQGGDAEVSIDAVNEGGGALSVDVAAGVTNGGILTLGLIRGTSSNGADVSVAGSFSASGGEILQAEAGGANQSGDLSLLNLVTGETTGALSLVQDVSRGGSENQRVESELNRSGSYDDLSLSAGAGSRFDARAAAFATNTTGGATAISDMRSSGAGGTGTAISEASGTGTGDVVATATSSLGGGIGSVEPPNGSSSAIARASTSGDGAVEAAAEATASFAAGVAAHAFGEGAGAGSVNVRSEILARDRGFETFEISADGRSLGGGDVTVTADISRIEETGVGATALRDAVSGATAGMLRLNQNVSSYTGDVETALDAVNAGGGDLEIRVEANPRAPFLLPGFRNFGLNTILGDVVGTSTTGANVSVGLVARGRDIRYAPEIAAGQVAEVRGASNGGDVSASGLWDAYFGEDDLIIGDELRAGAGNSLHADNWVRGETTGELSLTQLVAGGLGRISSFSSNPSGINLGGDGGEASSRLTRSGSFESLTLLAGSSAGNAGSATAFAVASGERQEGGKGGDALVRISGRNNAGRVEADGVAAGGRGGDGATAGGAGGDARREIVVESLGDGESVSVGNTSGQAFRRLLQAFSRTTGGQGGSLNTSSFGSVVDAPVSGAGGDALSRSMGTALGDSVVQVSDSARGGIGGSGSLFVSSPSSLGGNGGQAESEALASGGGVSMVSADALAQGGRGGREIARGGQGGDARSFASALGLGVAEASAIAVGGDASSVNADGGSGIARSEAVGASGILTADASTGFGTSMKLRASLSRTLSEGRSYVAEARAEHGVALSTLDREAAGAAMISARPLSADIENARDRNAELAALTEGTGSDKIRAMGLWHAEGTGPGLTEQSVELDITLREPESGDQLLLAIFDQEALNGGFESLSFRIELEGMIFGAEETFGDFDAAQAHFASVISLGSAFAERLLPGQSPALRVIFDLTQNSGQRIAFGLAAVVVPEPGAALLLGLGLIMLSLTRSRLNLSNSA